MAKVIVTEQYLTDIADAIRAKLDASDTYTPAQMAGAIESISGTNQDYEDALVAFGVQSDLADGITALTTYSNEVTGEDDTTLSDAVRSLADGYGGGDDTDFANTIMRSGAVTHIPDSVTKIGNYAFYRCASLALTELPSGVTSIGAYAFSSCTSLALTELPSGVTSIGPNAFDGCASLALTELPSGVTDIGTYAFYNCINLALTELPSGVTDIGTYAFSSCTSLALTELPSGVTSIGAYAFSSCTSLALTELPSGVTSIGPNAFRSCSGLALTELPSGLTSISSNAFYSCNGLQQLDAQNVGTISSNAFYSCSNLTELVLRKSGKACTLSNVNAFTNTPMRGYKGKSGTVYVPQALIETYKTATNWSTIYNEGHLTFASIEGSEYERD